MVLDKGSRVTYSEKALCHGTKGIDSRCNRKRLGTIVGEAPDGHAWQILWDGLKYPQSYHKDFIDPAPEQPTEPPPGDPLGR